MHLIYWLLIDVFQNLEKAVVGSFAHPEQSFFKEKGLWIMIGGILLLCLVVVLSLLWYRHVRRRTLIFYRPKGEGMPYIANLVWCEFFERL